MVEGRVGIYSQQASAARPGSDATGNAAPEVAAAPPVILVSAGEQVTATPSAISAPKRIDTAPGPEALQGMDEKAAALIKLFGKSYGVLLLRVAADARYKVDFDWDDFERWPIATDGSISGVPEAY